MGQQSKKRCPDFPLPGDLPQFFQEDPKVFSGKPGNILYILLAFSDTLATLAPLCKCKKKCFHYAFAINLNIDTSEKLPHDNIKTF